MTTLRETAESFLEADPRVASFSIVEVDARLDIAVTPAAEWIAQERGAAHATLSGRILRQWQMVYDRSYRWDKVVRPPNFDAWISGFTGAPIPVPRMQVWLDDALAQMRSVPHGRVLEVGCGVGLVAAALAPGGSAYHGIDFSEEAIASLGAWLATQPALSHVRLAQRAAHELDDLSVDADLAILNSVVQYFPDADYLLRVLDSVAAHIVPGGAVFLGDLRAAALLPMRATSIAAARAGDGATVGQVRTDAVALLGLARELAVDPGLLETLSARLPRLGAVRFSLKPEAADHELSGYRFDAMLLLDTPRQVTAPSMAAGSLGEIVERLQRARPDAMAVLGAPNARLAGDAALARAIATAASDARLADLSPVPKPDAIEPAALAAAAGALGYDVELRFSPGSAEGRFDALLRRPGVPARWPDAEARSASANDPLGDELAARLRRDLQASLDAAVGGRGLTRVELTP